MARTRTPWTTKATHASVEATQIGYRATVYQGKEVIGSAHFKIPREYMVKNHSKGCDITYRKVKEYLAGFGVA